MKFMSEKKKNFFFSFLLKMHSLNSNKDEASHVDGEQTRITDT